MNRITFPVFVNLISNIWRFIINMCVKESMMLGNQGNMRDMQMDVYPKVTCLLLQITLGIYVIYITMIRRCICQTYHLLSYSHKPLKTSRQYIWHIYHGLYNIYYDLTIEVYNYAKIYLTTSNHCHGSIIIYLFFKIDVIQSMDVVEL